MPQDQRSADGVGDYSPLTDHEEQAAINRILAFVAGERRTELQGTALEYSEKDLITGTPLPGEDGPPTEVIEVAPASTAAIVQLWEVLNDHILKLSRLLHMTPADVREVLDALRSKWE